MLTRDRFIEAMPFNTRLRLWASMSLFSDELKDFHMHIFRFDELPLLVTASEHNCERPAGLCRGK